MPSIAKSSAPVFAVLLACGDAGKGGESSTGTPGTSTTGGTTASTGDVTTGQVTTTTGQVPTTGGSDSDGGTGTSTGVPTTGTSTGDATTTTTTTTTTESSSSGSESSGGELCQAQGESCAMPGELCCDGLDCCGGVPIPAGEEFCSNMCPISDRNHKAEFAAIDPAQVLEKIVALPITSWRYRKDGPEVRHIGPMAQDFHAAFGLWNSDTMIFPLDASGVSMAAIQGLYARLQAAEAENEDLRARLERLERRLGAAP